METCVALRLANDGRAGLEIEASALVDTGALHLCIPEHVALQLKLKDVEIREVTLAGGHIRQVRYVSPVRVEILGRACVTGALVLGNQVLLGSIPMDDLDLVIEPLQDRVTVNPRARPKSLCRRLRAGITADEVNATKAVSGKIYICFSSNDDVLNYAYRGAGVLRSIPI